MADTEIGLRLIDNADDERYELWIGDERAGALEYESQGDVLILVHTEIDRAFQGRGLATRLVQAVLRDIRARNLKLVAVCPFVRSYLREHPEESDLVGHRHRG